MNILRNSATEESTWLEPVAGQEQRHVMASLIAEGNRWLWSNKQFRLELVAWVRSNDSVARDGIPGSAQAADDLLSSSGPKAVLNSDLGEGQAAKDQQLAETAPVLAILGTTSDSPLYVECSIMWS